MAGRYNSEKHHRRSIRLKGYDYADQGAYFVTICTWNRECLLGDIINGAMQLNEYGEIADVCLKGIPKHFACVNMDSMIVMPNHVHLILIINDDGNGKERNSVRRGVFCRGVACYAPTDDINYYSEISPKRKSLPTIIRSYKSAVTKQINILRNHPRMPVWQRNYYEHVIRHEKDLNWIRQYIINNPFHWGDDENNPINCMKTD